MDSSRYVPLSCLCCLLFLLPDTATQTMTECERGVKRPHPTQENAFQIFVRSDRTTKWIDQSCPAPKIFDPTKCTCVTPSTESPAIYPKTTPSPRPSSRGRKSPWFSRSKPLRKQGDGGRRKAGQRKRGSTPSPQDLGLDYRVTSSPWEAQAEDQAPVAGVTECPHHRPREEDPGQYEQWTEGGWMFMDCNWPVNSGLIWNQDLCRCDWGPNRIIAQPDLNSIPAVCLMMLKMTFEDGEIKDVGRDLWLDLRHPYSMEAIRDDTAVGGWTGAFRGSGISVPFFKMNTLGSTFRIKFRFQLCDGQPDADLMLINNGCVESDALPSLQVTYRAWANILAFQMATMNTMGPFREECHIQTQDPWIDINIHYDEDRLEILANGVQCVHSAAFSGPIVQTDCPLTLLEDNYCGLFDEVVITRGCNAMQES